MAKTEIVCVDVFKNKDEKKRKEEFNRLLVLYVNRMLNDENTLYSPNNTNTDK